MVFMDGTIIGQNRAPYIVAEVNSSHNGDVETAKRMIDAAVDCGCDCVKFQSWSCDSLYSKSYYDENPIAKRFVKKFSLDEEQLLGIVGYCREKGIAFSSTPYSEKEVDFLVSINVPFIKIASMELNNPIFLRYIAKTGFPIVLSTGMGSLEEIRKAVEIIKNEGAENICLLHCISIYPAKPETINLNNILMLKKEFPECEVGFSDHSVGIEMASAAIALGACLIEKHLTLDKTRIGMDNQMATEPEEMKLLVNSCQNVKKAMGSFERIVSDDEMKQRTNMRRSLVYKRDMKAGDIMDEDDFEAKRPGTGIPPDEAYRVRGKRLVKDVLKDTLVKVCDFEM